MIVNGICVRVVSGTTRPLPTRILRAVDRVELMPEGGGDPVVMKDRGRGEAYSVVITLGPGRTDFSLSGTVDEYRHRVVNTIWGEWFGDAPVVLRTSVVERA